MCKEMLSKRMYHYLRSHTRNTQKEIAGLIKEYYSDNFEESMNIIDFFKEYTDTLNGFLKNAAFYSGTDNQCPFVIIRSIVELQDTQTQETERYFIALPYSPENEHDVDYASCLSPLGKALLLRNKGEEVTVNVPAGTINYIIKDIYVPDSLIDESELSEEASESEQELKLA